MTVLGLEYFTPLTGTFGGALIGLSAGTLLLISGDILGASGVVSSVLLYPKKAITDSSIAWKLVLLSVFFFFSNVILGAHFTDDERLGHDPSIPVVSVAGYLLAGAFVGFGTRLGNGCTTGHGICGMARLSKRSFVAVAGFMTAALATANIVAPDNKAFANGTKWLRTTDDAPVLFNRWIGFTVACVVIFLPTLIALYNLWRLPAAAAADFLPVEQATATPAKDVHASSALTILDHSENSTPPTESPAKSSDEEKNHPREDDDEQIRQEKALALAVCQRKEHIGKLPPAALAGALFAVGLAVSGMVLPSKVLGFLNLTLMATKGAYDPTLMTVMGGGVIVSFISYQFVEKYSIIKNPFARQCPLSSPEFRVPDNTTIDLQLIVGSVCFGIGWGLCGLCPGPSIFLAACGTKPVLFYWWPTFLAGSFVAQKVKDMMANKQ